MQTAALRLVAGRRSLVAAHIEKLVAEFASYDHHLASIFWEVFDSARKPTNLDAKWMNFVSFVAKRLDLAHGQLLQDLWAAWEHDEKRGGYFVEIGAADGSYLSNTLLLEKKYGWSGLLCEPNPIFRDSLAAKRNCVIDTRCVWSVSNVKLQLRAVQEPELSVLSNLAPTDSHEIEGARDEFNLIDVESVSLNDLLEQVGSPYEIDYLSIDVEGAEFEILQTLDFSKYKIKLISVEHNYTDQRYKIADLLIKHGFAQRFFGMTRWDDWYTAVD